MEKKIIKILGTVLMLIGIIILLTMNNFVMPVIKNDSIDTGEYYIKMIINAGRYLVLSIILSSLGTKLLFNS